jgi:DNA-directed RNA polymerase subunit RPC12/RpoP
VIYFKSCLRCKGDVYMNSDSHGAFMKCLQCGFTRDMHQLPRTPELIAEAPVQAEPAYVERRAS